MKLERLLETLEVQTEKVVAVPIPRVQIHITMTIIEDKR